MGENNYLSAYKMINSQLVLNNQKLKEEIKDKIEMINELNEQLFKYREENKTLREMVQKLLEQFKTITTIMVSVRDQSESVFNVVYNEHAMKETEQQMRRPLAGIFYERRRTECPPYTDEAAILEGEDENLSMEDYRPAISRVEEEEELHEEELESNFVLSKSPLIKRLERKSRNRSFDESFETIDTNRVVKVARKSQEYLHGRDSRESKHSDDESMRETVVSEEMDISQTANLPQIILQEASKNESTNVEVIDQSSTIRNNFELSISSDHSGMPSDHSVQSDLNPVTDQSLRPATIKRMASESMLNTLIEQEINKENSGTNDTISNATCSTPLSRNRRPRIKATMHSPMSPVPLVSLKPLTKENLSQHNISFDSLVFKTSKCLKQDDLDRSEQASTESNDSRRPRRKAAPKVLKEAKLKSKLRRT
ncbi:uncharacterized protein LOC131690986 [Topomyia yanbarensis]|uniref:uncharacterized protein LOC131690986 n=1 Tax=Topomyia yanbarensis TaxID=2498891 RepID=UPI00273C9FBF|nr:uncharacterized protein LOC131690986 [Topomyia yanbarensis]